MPWYAIQDVLSVFAVGYLCGSIPFGLLITKFAGAGDVRSIGSGNIGATNVLRTGRKGLAAATLLADALKGAVAIWFFYNGMDIQLLGFMPHAPGPAAAIGGLGAFIGHLFPIWLKFKGGKGIATFAGLLIAASWKAFIVFAVVWLLVAALTRYSSLAALVATAITAPSLWFLSGQAPPEAETLNLLPKRDLITFAILFAFLTVLAWIKHRENIARLLSGTESKIGSKG